MNADVKYTSQLESMVLKLHKGLELNKGDVNLLKFIYSKAAFAEEKIPVLLRRKEH